MKIYFFTIALLCCSYYSLAQTSQIDSLKNTINATNDSKLKSELLVELIRNHLDPNKNQDYSMWAQKLCSLNVSKETRFECDRAKLKILLAEKKYDEHLRNSKQLLNQKYLQEDTLRKYIVYNFIIKNFYNQRESDSTIKYVSLAQKNIPEPSEGIYIYDRLAEMYYIKADYITATKYADSSLSLSNKFNRPKYKARALYRLAKIQRKTKFYDEALINYQSSLDILLKKDSISLGIGGTYLEMGKLAKEMKNFDISLGYLKKSFSIYQKLNRMRTLAQIHDEFSVCYIRLEDYENSFYHVNQAIKIKKEINVTSDLKHSYSRLGRLYYLIEDKDLDKSIHYLNLSKKLYEKKGTISQKMYLELYLNNVYRLKKDFNKAVTHYDQYIQFKDSLRKRADRKLIAETEVKYKTLEKENIIFSKNEEIDNKSNIIIGIIGIVLVTVLIVFYRKVRTKKRLKIFKKNTAQNFRDYLIKKYSLNKQNIEFWELWVTKLSQEEMADALYITENAVKSRRTALKNKINSIQKIDGDFDQARAILIYNKEKQIHTLIK